MNQKQTNDKTEQNEIDRLRELIIGPNLREIRRKLLYLDNKIRESAENIQLNNKEQLEIQDSTQKKQLDESITKANKEINDLSNQITTLKSNILSIENSVNDWKTKMEDQINSFEKLILKSRAEIEQENKKSIKELHFDFDKKLRELAENKMDRITLAGLMNALASQIGPQNSEDRDQDQHDER